ncbi:unnamed protein product [Paramecium sonneborni]|uniref:Phosphatidylinositol N-acetylglucosaminyltransferase n=1 Tax=Paramecium sonneborni TaxID=65129 RepID=A0A8S1QNY9_9CILI|nr:unnamed protein product [Paramecium sonneborni]
MDYFKYCPWDGYRFSDNDVQCFICRRPKYQLTSYIQEEQEQKKWEKILYEKQPYDDNYIDETFLQSVQKQDNSTNGPDYKQLISKTSDLIFAINCVVFYLLSYFLMLHDIINTQLQLYFWLTIAITCLIMYSVVKKMKTQEILSNFKSIGIYISILLLFAPVMQTVNQTYADNTIYVLTSVAILIYIFLKDYDYEKDFTELDVSSWASLVFSSLLASRLHNELQVFLMIFASNLLFIFVPILQRSIKQKYNSVFRLINLISTIGLGLSLLFFSYFLALLFFGCVFFITFVSPLQIIWLYQYKNTIRGPWDLPNVKQYD